VNCCQSVCSEKLEDLGERRVRFEPNVCSGSFRLAVGRHIVDLQIQTRQRQLVICVQAQQRETRGTTSQKDRLGRAARQQFADAMQRRVVFSLDCTLLSRDKIA
jgi:hypothetical protein